MIFWVRYMVAIVIFVVQSCVCTEISHPNITGNATCDETMELYADGVQYIHGNDNIWDAVSTINIPGSTQLIAIKCTNVYDWNGISADLSNGIKTDTSWKCSDDEEVGWNSVTFNDTVWRNAKLLPFWIWTTAGITGAGAIYCRKFINNTIIYPEIMGKVYCYDEMEFYADGERYTHQYDNKRFYPSPINISSSTKLIAIKCKNLEGARGLNVGLSNGVRTDTTWKCSNEEEEGWNNIGFNDSVWNNAKLLQVSNIDWIWTNENVRQQGTIYCRKSIFFGTSTATTTVVESCSPTTTVVELSTETTTVVELGTTTTTLVELLESCSPTSTVVELSTATSTLVELSTATTAVVESCSPTTTVVEPCSPTTKIVDPLSPSTTAVEPSSPTATVVEPSSPANTVVESRSPTSTVVEPCSLATTLLMTCTYTADFDLQPSSTGVAVVGSDGVLRSQVCQDVVVVTSESAMSEEAVSSIHKELTVDKNKMSSVIRKKVSQKDERPSSATIGYFGLIFAVLPLALIIISDIPKLIQHLKTLMRSH